MTHLCAKDVFNNPGAFCSGCWDEAKERTRHMIRETVQDAMHEYRKGPPEDEDRILNAAVSKIMEEI